MLLGLCQILVLNKDESKCSQVCDGAVSRLSFQASITLKQRTAV